ILDGVGTAMRLGFITDSHIDADGAPIWEGVDSYQNLLQTIEYLNKQELDAVVFGGDLAYAAERYDDARADAMYQAAKPALDQIKAPLFAILGNHDRHNMFAEYLGAYRQGDPGPDLTYIAEVDGWRLIMLDTVEPGLTEGMISDFSAEWVGEKIAENPDQPTLVFAHQPPFSCNADPAHDMEFHNSELLAEALIPCTGLKGIFSGHYHRVINWEWRGVPYHVGPSTAAQFPTPGSGFDKHQPEFVIPGLQIITANDTALSVETIWLGDDPFALAAKKRAAQSVV
ncbi:MAG: metallophosphoesterase, partial [Pseudomonadota bacterium]